MPPRLRVVPKEDCQGEAHVMAALKESVRLLNPGVDLERLAKERQQKHEAVIWQHWVAATETLRREMRNPIPHAIKYLQDMEGRAS
jgi:hypothetical protein